MRVMQTLQDLCKVMKCHFQRSISQAINVAIHVQMAMNRGESEYQSSCGYHYLFLFSGWWFGDCTVTLNGKYDGSLLWLGFKWLTQATSWVRPIRSEMKIR